MDRKLARDITLNLKAGQSLYLSDLTMTMRRTGMFILGSTFTIDCPDKVCIRINVVGAEKSLSSEEAWGVGRRGIELNHYFAVREPWSKIEFTIESNKDTTVTVSGDVEVKQMLTEVTDAKKEKSQEQCFICIDDYGVEQSFNDGVEYLGKSFDDTHLEMYNNRGEAVIIRKSRFKIQDEMLQV